MSFTTFETAIGQCGVGWGPRGLTRIQLRARPTASTTPPVEVQQAIDAMRALLDGQSADLSGVVLDMDGVPEFAQRVYGVARTIPPGTTLTYGEIAERLGDPSLAREVGQALARNPFPLVVPCHRVVAADGRLGGFSAPGGAHTKRRLLEIEGAQHQPALF
jgi:methylated-DNA-[protein]-cysteine S-methyltransferase